MARSTCWTGPSLNCRCRDEPGGGLSAPGSWPHRRRADLKDGRPSGCGYGRPYPPGFPILMLGERAGPIDGPVLSYLLALEDFDARFPGFAHDIHGVERDERGVFSIECLTEERRETRGPVQSS